MASKYAFTRLHANLRVCSTVLTPWTFLIGSMTPSSLEKACSDRLSMCICSSQYPNVKFLTANARALRIFCRTALIYGIGHVFFKIIKFDALLSVSFFITGDFYDRTSENDIHPARSAGFTHHNLSAAAYRSVKTKLFLVNCGEACFEERVPLALSWAVAVSLFQVVHDYSGRERCVNTDSRDAQVVYGYFQTFYWADSRAAWSLVSSSAQPTSHCQYCTTSCRTFRNFSVSSQPAQNKPLITRKMRPSQSLATSSTDFVIVQSSTNLVGSGRQ